MAKTKVTTKSKQLAAKNPIPAKLFSGRKVCLGSGFNHYPTKDELAKFLRKEGASIAAKVTSGIDLVIVSGGPVSSQQKQAEKLNAKGAAIEIQDLKTASLLWNLSPGDIVTAPGGMERCAEFPDFLFRDQVFAVSGEDFSSATIRCAKEKHNSEFEFKKCNLRATTLQDLHFDNPRFGGAVFLDCDFDNSRWRDVFVSRLTGCSLANVQGSNVEFYYLKTCVIKDSSFDTLQWTEFSDGEVVGSTIDGMRSRSFGHVFSHSQISRTTIKQPVMRDAKLLANSFTDCKFLDGEIDDVRFEKCKLTGVEFRDCKFSQMQFAECELKNCSFVGCSGSLIDFGNSTVQKCKIQKSSISVVHASGKHAKEVACSDGTEATDVSNYPELRKLGDVFVNSPKLIMSAKCKADGGGTTNISVSREWAMEFEYKPGRGKKGEFRLPNPGGSTKDAIALRLLRLVRDAAVKDIDAASLTTKSSKCPLKPKELKKLILAALAEAIGTEPVDDTQVAAATTTRRKATISLRKELLAELTSGDVKAFNKRTKDQRLQANPFKKVQLSAAKLGGLSAAELDLADSDLSMADLSAAKLMSAVLRNVKLTGAKLVKANLRKANLRGADLSGADLTGANLREATLTGASTKGTVFQNANLSGVDLRGADFSAANLIGAKMNGCSYDEKTKWPPSLKTSDLKPLAWFGGGPPPHKRVQNKQATGPLDFQQFMDRLSQITDKSRLSKATKMLKADAFQLFTDVADGSVAGVVKSQTDEKLVYSCMLNAGGDFTCCTQNLNPCGGLRGALCKHLLVLLIGLTKSGDLDATDVDHWINSSKVKQPSLDKEAMTEILLRYKGAEAGEIDWRPTETVPEDYFAY